MDALKNDPRLDFSKLEKYGFDLERFEKCRVQIAKGELTEKSSLVTDPIEPVDSVIEVKWDGAQGEKALALGEAALRKGEVAVVVLNGGMATRFGGVVKGTVEVFDGKSFIALKAEDTRRANEKYGAPVPLVLMNSFATDEATKKHVEENRYFGLDPANIYSFTQSMAVRLNPDGTVFIGADGEPSYYAPGHGDFFRFIRASGVLGKLVARGVRYLLFSNVDNLGATVDPVVIGHHIQSGAEMSAEVTAKRKTASGEWDKGGAPAKIKGRPQLVEGFRFPPDMPPTFLPDFSTNNFVFTAKAIDKEVPLDWYLVKKKVDGKNAIQLESITCEATGSLAPDGSPLLKVAFLRVPRDGDRGRFFPIKEREDLDALRGDLKRRLEAGWKS
jgi:UTP--glucose-1-phosphate uridylyltransferase